MLRLSRTWNRLIRLAPATFDQQGNPSDLRWEIEQQLLEHVLRRAGNAELVANGQERCLAEHACGNQRSLIDLADQVLDAAPGDPGGDPVLPAGGGVPLASRPSPPAVEQCRPGSWITAGCGGWRRQAISVEAGRHIGSGWDKAFLACERLPEADSRGHGRIVPHLHALRVSIP